MVNLYITAYGGNTHYKNQESKNQPLAIPGQANFLDLCWSPAYVGPQMWLHVAIMDGAVSLSGNKNFLFTSISRS